MPFDRKIPALPAAVRDRNAPRSAFTLVELLVTIAVIAVLAALASAALPAVLESGHRVQCQARLSHLGQALLLYAQDNAMTLPGAGQRPTGNPVTSVCYTYTRDILPYLGLTEEEAKQQRALALCRSVLLFAPGISRSFYGAPTSGEKAPCRHPRPSRRAFRPFRRIFGDRTGNRRCSG